MMGIRTEKLLNIKKVPIAPLTGPLIALKIHHLSVVNINFSICSSHIISTSISSSFWIISQFPQVVFLNLTAPYFNGLSSSLLPCPKPLYSII